MPQPKPATSETPTRRRRVRRGAIGVLPRDGLFLMIKRAAGVIKGGCWCFPGGHVEAGENSKRAVQRELFEELGIGVIPHRRLGAIRLEAAGYVLAVWHVSLDQGEIVPASAEVAEVRWVGVSDIATIEPGLPSNVIVASMIAKWLGTSE